MPIFLPWKIGEKYTLILLPLPILIAKSISAIAKTGYDGSRITPWSESEIHYDSEELYCSDFLANLIALGRQKR